MTTHESTEEVVSNVNHKLLTKQLVRDSKFTTNIRFTVKEKKGNEYIDVPRIITVSLNDVLKHKQVKEQFVNICLNEQSQVQISDAFFELIFNHIFHKIPAFKNQFVSHGVYRIPDEKQIIPIRLSVGNRYREVQLCTASYALAAMEKEEKEKTDAELKSEAIGESVPTLES